MSGQFVVYVRKPGRDSLVRHGAFSYGDKGYGEILAEVQAHRSLVDWLDKYYPDQWHVATNGTAIPPAALRVMLEYNQVPQSEQYQEIDGLPGSKVPGMVNHYKHPEPTLEQRIDALERRVQALEAR